MNLHLAKQLTDALPSGQAGLFNPWADQCPHATQQNTVETRLMRLAQHLDCEARLILVGEAPGYQGCRYSGIAFTSERQLLAGTIPRVPRLDHRLSTRSQSFSEPSATIIWRTLYRLKMADRSILWNAVQLHPHMPGTVWGNRTPKTAELAYGRPALQLLREAFPLAHIVAVGKKAERALDLLGISYLASVRHPANGGATLFDAGLSQCLAGIGTLET